MALASGVDDNVCYHSKDYYTIVGGLDHLQAVAEFGHVPGQPAVTGLGVSTSTMTKVAPDIRVPQDQHVARDNLISHLLAEK